MNLRLCFPAFIALISLTCNAQEPVALSSTLARTEGTEAISAISFTRLYLSAQTDSPPQTFSLGQPTLTIQCTVAPHDKYKFEVFINYGGITDTTFYPPWRPVNEQDLFPPRTDKTTVTMEFLGYTRVKPVRRQFEFVIHPTGQLRYNNPSSGSPNMEEIAYYFQYLRALPTLRVSYASHTATFLTEPLLAQIRKEPLCKASGL